MKTDIELLEYLLGELEACAASLDDNHLAEADRLRYLFLLIYDQLSSKSIQTDYVLPAWL